MLRGGDRRKSADVDEAAAAAVRDPRLFDALIDAIGGEDHGLAQRAAGAADQASAERPDLLAAHAPRILGPLAAVPCNVVRSHLAPMLARMRLTDPERERAIALLLGWLEHGDDEALRANALEALAALGEGDEAVRAVLERAAAEGPAAVRVRARRVLGRRRRR
ncbi:MAG: hypothetical protein QOJ07_2364 [Thermoleophilaceae bacterium]|jgi:hypothetical protein|nr:hypothetical protein [Thermoleophilaceae bacterium]